MALEPEAQAIARPDTTRRAQRPDQRRELDGEQLTPFLSPYLTGGWREDDLTLERVQFTPGTIQGWLRVQRHFMPTDGEFHLSVPVAFLWVAQLAIIYACLDEDLAEKPGEAYLRELTLQARERVTATDAIRVQLDLRARRELHEGIYYLGDIDIGDGAFTGGGKFVIPVPS